MITDKELLFVRIHIPIKNQIIKALFWYILVTNLRTEVSMLLKIASNLDEICYRCAQHEKAPLCEPEDRKDTHVRKTNLTL